MLQRRRLTPVALAAALLLAAVLRPATAARPHVVVMLADDLGYHNVGWHSNPEIRSPHLDSLARTGVRLENHYTFKFCSPTRSSLMSGRLPIHVNQNNDCNSILSASGIDLRMTILPAKLKTAGYATAMTGKWHGGARSLANLPINRGFDSHLGFLKGGEDHFHQNHCAGGPTVGTVDLWEDHAPAFGKNGTFSTYIYAKRAVDVITQHPDNTPLFLYLPWHVVHTPLEAPQQYFYPNMFNNSNKDRHTMNAMVRVLDEGVKNVTDALQRRGMWNNTLLVFSADNGGWGGSTGGNNWPLRGTKVSDFQGGVRTAAFVNGGLLPDNVRGGVHTGYIHVADWYTTILTLAGVDPSDTHAGVPPTDGLDVWPSILTPNASATPRTSIALATGDLPDAAGIYASDGGIIVGDYKLVVGTQQNRGYFQGPVYPNGTKDYKDAGCPRGCLFNLRRDPTEHIDLREAEPAAFLNLTRAYAAAVASTYQTNYPEPGTSCITQAEAAVLYKGFIGPYCKPTAPAALG